MNKPDLREIAKTLRLEMGCNCDLDNWAPEQSTGHSHVCRIHKRCLAIKRGDAPMPIVRGETSDE